MTRSSTGQGNLRKLLSKFALLVPLGAASVLLATGLSLSSGSPVSAAAPVSPCTEVVSTAPGVIVATPSGALVTGAKAGSTRITIDCNVTSTATYALESSLLGGIGSTSVTAANEADIATLATFARSTTDKGCPAASAGLCTVATLIVPTSFVAKDSKAACPPTQAQIDAGLFGCAIAVVNSALAPLPGGEFLITYAGQPLPGAPTITATPQQGSTGTQISIGDSKGTSHFWWGNAIEAVQAATLSTTPIASPATCKSGGGYGNVPTSFLTVKWFSSPAVTPINASATGVTISNDCYDGVTLNAPSLSGSITVPAGLALGTVYTVYVCELNATPYPTNDASAAVHCGTAPAGATWIDASFPFTTAAGAITQSAPTSGSVTAAGSKSFTAQLAVTGASGAVTYVAHAQGPDLNVSALGLVSTQHALVAGNYTVSGTMSDAAGDIGAFTYTLHVGMITQIAPLSGSVVTSSSSKWSQQLMVSGANGAVTYNKTAGTGGLVVSTSGVVGTTGALAAGNYTVSGTTTDSNGDSGTFTYALTVTQAPVPQLRAYRVIGRVVAGRTVTLLIKGVGFYGRPRITSHAGTRSIVVRDTGRQLTVRTTARAGSRDGNFTFTIVLANHKLCKVRYSQVS
ncbi:MAG: hypothetical protein ACYC1I_05300 [Acidimicrobiales bacterium]